MEALRYLMSRKKAGDRNHSSWRTVCDAWYKMIFPKWIITHDFSSSEYKDWNPWKDWCESWEEFQSSEEKPPKSEKPKAALFSQLSFIAKLTREKLEDAKTMRTDLEQTTGENLSLRTQNFILKKQCEELQRELLAEKQMIIQNDLLKEKEVNLRKSLEDQKEHLTFQLYQKDEELKEHQAKCRELEKTCSSFQDQLVECQKQYGFQFNIKNDFFIIPGCKYNQPHLRAQLENGGVENSLHLGSITNIVDRLGKVDSWNVLDWLCSCGVEYGIWKWSQQDFEEILHSCMDSRNFSLLLNKVKTGKYTWLYMCKKIAETFHPDLDDMLDKEQMREDDKVLKYFDRMWMLYRIGECSNPSSKDDPKYKNAICEGLLPHLNKMVQNLRDEDYEVLERAARMAEYFCLVCEEEDRDGYVNARKAIAGCPSRKTIWKRLQRYNVPNEEIHDAPYGNLLVHLSRYEDLLPEEYKKLRV
ncbi:uncharacterized protein LOC142748681 [Rhinoderma darwinii]|uniref:uncharacterized protein LOC142748681 n=1 Tax=Rhinoderma darwinii TaxID=43563 RepID=UPI003F67BCCF